MKFSMSVYDANKLYAHAKAEQLKKQEETLPKLSLIQCRIDNDTLIAQFINYHECAEIRIPVEDVDGNGMFWIVPPPKKFVDKKDVSVIVEDEEESTAYVTARGRQVITKPKYDHQEFKTESFWHSDPEATIYVDPKLLMDALSAYSDQYPVKIELLGKKTGIYISSEDYDEKTFLLPVNASAGSW